VSATTTESTELEPFKLNASLLGSSARNGSSGSETVDAILQAMPEGSALLTDDDPAASPM
jgi:hypothetical protein